MEAELGESSSSEDPAFSSSPAPDLRTAGDANGDLSEDEDGREHHHDKHVMLLRIAVESPSHDRHHKLAKQLEEKDLALRTAQYERDLLAHQLQAISAESQTLRGQVRALQQSNQRLLAAVTTAQQELAVQKRQAAQAAAAATAARAQALAAANQQQQTAKLLRMVQEQQQQQQARPPLAAAPQRSTQAALALGPQYRPGTSAPIAQSAFGAAAAGGKLLGLPQGIAASIAAARAAADDAASDSSAATDDTTERAASVESDVMAGLFDDDIDVAPKQPSHTSTRTSSISRRRTQRSATPNGHAATGPDAQAAAAQGGGGAGVGGDGNTESTGLKMLPPVYGLEHPPVPPRVTSPVGHSPPPGPAPHGTPWPPAGQAAAAQAAGVTGGRVSELTHPHTAGDAHGRPPLYLVIPESEGQADKPVFISPPAARSGQSSGSTVPLPVIAEEGNHAGVHGAGQQAGSLLQSLPSSAQREGTAAAAGASDAAAADPVRQQLIGLSTCTQHASSIRRRGSRATLTGTPMYTPDASIPGSPLLPASASILRSGEGSWQSLSTLAQRYGATTGEQSPGWDPASRGSLSRHMSLSREPSSVTAAAGQLPPAGTTMGFTGGYGYGGARGLSPRQSLTGASGGGAGLSSSTLTVPSEGALYAAGEAQGGSRGALITGETLGESQGSSVAATRKASTVDTPTVHHTVRYVTLPPRVHDESVTGLEHLPPGPPLIPRSKRPLRLTPLVPDTHPAADNSAHTSEPTTTGSVTALTHATTRHETMQRGGLGGVSGGFHVGSVGTGGGLSSTMRDPRLARSRTVHLGTSQWPGAGDPTSTHSVRSAASPNDAMSLPMSPSNGLMSPGSTHGHREAAAPAFANRYGLVHASLMEGAHTQQGTGQTSDAKQVGSERRLPAVSSHPLPHPTQTGIHHVASVPVMAAHLLSHPSTGGPVHTFSRHSVDHPGTAAQHRGFAGPPGSPGAAAGGDGGGESGIGSAGPQAVTSHRKLRVSVPSTGHPSASHTPRSSYFTQAYNSMLNTARASGHATPRGGPSQPGTVRAHGGSPVAAYTSAPQLHLLERKGSGTSLRDGGGSGVVVGGMGMGGGVLGGVGGGGGGAHMHHVASSGGGLEHTYHHQDRRQCNLDQTLQLLQVLEAITSQERSVIDSQLSHVEHSSAEETDDESDILGLRHHNRARRRHAHTQEAGDRAETPRTATNMAVSSALDQVLTSVGSNVPSPHRHATHDKSQPLSTHATDTAQGAVSAGGSEAAGGAATQSEHDVPKPDPFVTVQSTLPTTHDVMGSLATAKRAPSSPEPIPVCLDPHGTPLTPALAQPAGLPPAPHKQTHAHGTSPADSGPASHLTPTAVPVGATDAAAQAGHGVPAAQTAGYEGMRDMQRPPPPTGVHHHHLALTPRSYSASSGTKTDTHTAAAPPLPPVSAGQLSTSGSGPAGVALHPQPQPQQQRAGSGGVSGAFTFDAGSRQATMSPEPFTGDDTDTSRAEKQQYEFAVSPHTAGIVLPDTVQQSQQQAAAGTAVGTAAGASGAEGVSDVSAEAAGSPVSPSRIGAGGDRRPGHRREHTFGSDATAQEHLGPLFDELQTQEQPQQQHTDAAHTDTGLGSVTAARTTDATAPADHEGESNTGAASHVPVRVSVGEGGHDGLSQSQSQSVSVFSTLAGRYIDTSGVDVGSVGTSVGTLSQGSPSGPVSVLTSQRPCSFTFAQPASVASAPVVLAATTSLPSLVVLADTPFVTSPRAPRGHRPLNAAAGVRVQSVSRTASAPQPLCSEITDGWVAQVLAAGGGDVSTAPLPAYTPASRLFNPRLATPPHSYVPSDSSLGAYTVTHQSALSPSSTGHGATAGIGSSTGETTDISVGVGTSGAVTLTHTGEGGSGGGSGGTGGAVTFTHAHVTNSEGGVSGYSVGPVSTEGDSGASVGQEAIGQEGRMPQDMGAGKAPTKAGPLKAPAVPLSPISPLFAHSSDMSGTSAEDTHSGAAGASDATRMPNSSKETEEVLTQASDTLTAGPYTHSPSHTSHIDNSDTFTVTATPLNVLRPIALNQMPVRAAHNQQQQQQQEQGGPTQPAAPGKKQQVAAQAAVALHTRPEWQARVVRGGGGGMAGVGHTATTPVWPPPPQQHTRGLSHTESENTGATAATATEPVRPTRELQQGTVVPEPASGPVLTSTQVPVLNTDVPHTGTGLVAGGGGGVQDLLRELLMEVRSVQHQVSASQAGIAQLQSTQGQVIQRIEKLEATHTQQHQQPQLHTEGGASTSG